MMAYGKRAKVLARKKVGDGKSPNRYFVSVANDYSYVNEEGCVDWIGEAIKGFKSRGETVAMFDRYQQAKECAIGLFDSTERDEEGYYKINTVYVEDRQVGELFVMSKIINLYTLNCVVETRDDYDLFNHSKKKGGTR